MAQLIADRRDVDFVLHEQLDVDKLSKDERFAEFGKKTVDLIVSEARNLAIKEILPLQTISDEGCTFNAGDVKVPDAFHSVYAAYNEGEWLGMTDDPEWGGQGMPHTVAMAANEYFYGACNSFMLYNMLTHGAAKLVEKFGTDDQKRIYLKNMLSGKWSGTMLLTEPNAGSDLAAVEATAKPNGDGTYSLFGNKIFISAGEHDMVENIIHPVLARIEGAPEGIAGISLFLAPKFRVNADGSPGEFNDVVCTGIEHKMGLHGNATCSLTLGGKSGCIGTLLGQENKGVAAMFEMMNEARQMVGLQGFANASASYMYALNYARERIQSRELKAPAASKSVPIIRHPDVKRQLITMKAYVEGLRSLNYFCAMCHDLVAVSTDAEQKTHYEYLLEVLTPIVKGYGTDKSFDVCNQGIQIYGGYGFIEEFPVAQLLRDSRIFMLYEGTNGIQSIDLLGRKLSMKKGAAFNALLVEIKKTIADAKAVDGLEDLTARLEGFFSIYTEVAAALQAKSRSDEFLTAYAFSYPFMEVTGDLAMAWMLLWRAATATANKGKKKKDNIFYDGQIKTARFFINQILAATAGKMDALKACDNAVVEMDEAAFGSK
ncbi:MAG: acyl-CoA dehydrogenase [Desulfobacter postgatei]|uniref:acyl-CoA dehydrogenase n=2 Tax=Desulfobacter postgatei TaxID=2293 RepID=UPI0023F3A1FB|nr:acyl-CoA dehydrogenase [Desulfobacter postgatei]MDD4273498.1 acyl-CoA dehydrogenase [Desulfobacter postgatei]